MVISAKIAIKTLIEIQTGAYLSTYLWKNVFVKKEWCYKESSAIPSFGNRGRAALEQAG